MKNNISPHSTINKESIADRERQLNFKTESSVERSNKLQSTNEDYTQNEPKLDRLRFLKELFREYDNLPLRKSLYSFAKVYNDVFVKELPNASNYYALNAQMMFEISKINTEDECCRIPFDYSFAQHTSRWVNFAKSKAFQNKM